VVLFIHWRVAAERRGESGVVLFYWVGAGAFVVMDRGRRWPSLGGSFAAAGLRRRGDGYVVDPTDVRTVADKNSAVTPLDLRPTIAD